MICEITDCEKEIMPGVPWCPEHAKEAEDIGILVRKPEFALHEGGEK